MKGNRQLHDAFSKRHPAVNFVFFLGVIVASALIQHPAYVLAGFVTGAIYYLMLNGAKGLKFLLLLLPVFVFVAAINPLFNTDGQRILCHVFGRPYTYEALLYGLALSGVIVVMLLWFGCYNQVLTGDKFTSLFGNLIPAISLLLVMVFRMVPNFIRKARQFAGARKSIGKGAGENATAKEKVTDGLTLLGALTTWALEGSVVTGDSMRARGYGTAKRSSFMIYRMTLSDWLLMAAMVLLLGLTLVAAYFGQTAAAFTPVMEIAPVSWGICSYTLFLMIPILYHWKEAAQWYISRSKI
ncbi:MAG: energy-coupling factor transporter transmembrane protein EcfT [Oscillospiraceae bacterium]|nr:energy-coupling factor transporter transmembrane protein EcfT [Oscillospiraceae bacterium]